MYDRVTTPKKPEAKSVTRPSSTKSKVSQGSGVGSMTPSAAAKDRRSPVVTDQTIATNHSVMQAATDRSIKELVIKQQMMDRKQRESMDKKRPRADGTTGLFTSLEHSGSFTSSGHHHSHSGQSFHKYSSFDETNISPNEHHYEADRGFVKYVPSSPDAHHHSHYAQQQGGATPGSFSDTVFPSEVTTPNGGGIAQLDDVNSEITADAGTWSPATVPVFYFAVLDTIPRVDFCSLRLHGHPEGPHGAHRAHGGHS